MEVEVNANELLSQLFSILGYTFDGKVGASIHSPTGSDLEICYLDREVVIACYCHETKKHFSLAYVSEIKRSLFGNPGEVTCSKEHRSFFKSRDHCESGVYEEERDVELYVENKESQFKKKKNFALGFIHCRDYDWCHHPLLLSLLPPL